MIDIFETPEPNLPNHELI